MEAVLRVVLGGKDEQGVVLGRSNGQRPFLNKKGRVWALG